MSYAAIQLQFDPPARVLVVDDEQDVRGLIVLLLQEQGCKVMAADNGPTALQLAVSDLPDLVLMDVNMPGMDGMTVCRRLKEMSATKSIPVVFLTANDNIDHYRLALEAGAEDFFPKPFKRDVLLARVRASVKAKRMADEIDEYRRRLENRVLEQTLQIRETQDATIFALAKLAECRDPETGQHLERIRHISRYLASKLQDRKPFVGQIDNVFLDSIFRSSVLHDIGKVGIPDDILLKPGKLEPEEFEIMKTHAKIGGDALDAACKELHSDPYLEMARDIAYSHHERVDGSGYPAKLVGDAIPLAARIVAVADVFDALMTKRPYKEAFSIEKTFDIMKSGRGTQFDPDVYDVFAEHLATMKRIRDRYVDA